MEDRLNMAPGRRECRRRDNAGAATPAARSFPPPPPPRLMADGPGYDGGGKQAYETPDELWKEVEGDKEKGWYGGAVAYW